MTPIKNPRTQAAHYMAKARVQPSPTSPSEGPPQLVRQKVAMLPCPEPWELTALAAIDGHTTLNVPNPI